jgi:pilus assembly protein Flp/PilA
VTKFLDFGKSLLDDETGATAIEYGLLAALISVAILVTVQTLGGTLKGVFSNVDTQLKPSVGASAGTGTTTP